MKTYTSLGPNTFLIPQNDINFPSRPQERHPALHLSLDALTAEKFPNHDRSVRLGIPPSGVFPVQQVSFLSFTQETGRSGNPAGS